jgi:hypothetical protein
VENNKGGIEMLFSAGMFIAAGATITIALLDKMCEELQYLLGRHVLKIDFTNYRFCSCDLFLRN